MITQTLGLLFIAALLYIDYWFLTRGKIYNNVKEPSLERIWLDRTEIAKKTIDVPADVVIGR